jgi:hypothetical protein
MTAEGSLTGPLFVRSTVPHMLLSGAPLLIAGVGTCALELDLEDPDLALDGGVVLPLKKAWVPAHFGGTGPCFAARETTAMLQMISRRRNRLAFAIRRRGC